ncbi:MAG: hypothetical protein R3Y29_06200 [bacterium]
MSNMNIYQLIKTKFLYILSNKHLPNNQKYILLKVKNPDHSKTDFLYRIRAIKSFNDVKAGDLGGYVSGEDNLSQEGNCWIYDDSMVLDYAFIDQNALIFRNSIIRDNARISSNTNIVNSHISDNVYIIGESQVFESVIKNDVSITGSAIVINSLITDNVEIKNNSRVISANIKEFNKLFDNTFVYRSSITGGYTLKDNIIIRKSTMEGFEELAGDVYINNNKKSDKININNKKLEKERSIEYNYNPDNRLSSYNPDNNLLIRDIGNALSRIESNIKNRNLNNSYSLNNIYKKNKPHIVDEFLENKSDLDYSFWIKVLCALISINIIINIIFNYLNMN